VSGVTASDNDYGLWLAGNPVSDTEIVDGTFERNGTGIIVFGNSSTANIIANNTVRATEGDGITVAFSLGEAYERWTISQNSTAGNLGLGIDIVGAGDVVPGVTANDSGDADTGANTLLNYPEWDLISGYAVAPGTACANCLIEVFKSDGDASGHGEGELFLGDTVADGTGAFSFNICGVSAGDEITATATDANGNTSEFSQNYGALEDAPPCLGLNGDLDCDGAVDGRDALVAFLHHVLATQLSREAGCPAIGSSTPTVSSEQKPSFFGDVNCTGTVDHVDGFAILKYIAGVLYDTEPVGICTRIGDPL
jgi:hypothetical protein